MRGLRRVAPAAARQRDRELPERHVRRHRQEGRAAPQPEARTDRGHVPDAPARDAGQRERLGVPAPPGRRGRLRAHRHRREAQLLPPGELVGRAECRRPQQREPPQPPRRLQPPRAARRRDGGGAGQGGRGPGLGRHHQEGARRHRADQDRHHRQRPQARPSWRASSRAPTSWPSTCRSTTAKEVDNAAKALAERVAAAFTEMEGQARGDPELQAGAAVTIGLLGAPFDGKYVITSSRHTYDVDRGLHDVVHHQRAPGAVAARPDGRHGVGAPGRVSGVVPAVVDDVDDPDQHGRVRAALPVDGREVRQRLEPGRPRRRRERTAASSSCPRSATRCSCRSIRARCAGRSCSAASTTARTSRRPGPTRSSTARPMP